MNRLKPGDKARVIAMNTFGIIMLAGIVSIPFLLLYAPAYITRIGIITIGSEVIFFILFIIHAVKKQIPMKNNDLEPIEPVQEEKQGNRPELNMKKEQFKMVAELLGVNGFKQSEEYSVSNYLCEVKMMDNCFAVYNNSGDAMFSPNLEIYWLIGVLTYYGYMDKNYKQ